MDAVVIVPRCFTHYLPKLNQLNQQTLLHYPLNHESRVKNWINTIPWIMNHESRTESTLSISAESSESTESRAKFSWIKRIKVWILAEYELNQLNQCWFSWINWIKWINNTIPYWINWIKDSNLHYLALWQPRTREGFVAGFSAPNHWCMKKIRIS